MPSRSPKLIYIVILLFQSFLQAQQFSPQNTLIAPVELIDHRNSSLDKKKESIGNDKLDAQSGSGPQRLNDDYLTDDNSLQSTGLFWLNMYNSKRNTYLLNDGLLTNNEQMELMNIANQSLANAENTFEANYIKLRETRNSDQAFRFLRKANEVSPNNTFLYVEKAWQAERTGNNSLLKSNINAAYNVGQVSTFLTKLSSFILQLAKSNSIIITNGENDTYPFWYLSNNKNITVISLAFIEDIAYLNKKLKSANSEVYFSKVPTEREFLNAILKSSKTIYLSWGVRPDILETFVKDLYPVGPMLQFSKESVDNVNLLKSFYLNQEVYDYFLKESWASDKYFPFAKNLFPGIKFLIDSNSLSDSELRRVRKLETVIGDKTSNTR